MSIAGGAIAPLTPVGFIKKWSKNFQSEKRIAQAHFNDLCRLLNHPTPADDDPSGEHFSFERAATKIGGGRGYADVWKENYFAWEYKSRDENLDAAHRQLITYAPALGNPPLQVVCDFKRFKIFTAWTNTLPEAHEVALEDFVKPDRLDLLRNVFHAPEKLRPVRIRSALTKEAADKFATIALRMQGRGSAEEIAHFVNQLVFCFFAVSVGLLSQETWSTLLKRGQRDPSGARNRFDKLFHAMRIGGDYGAEKVVHFNGGLFDGQRALPLDEGDFGLLQAANSLDWSMIDPTIFGSLFERFLDPKKRAQIGAHYTDAEKIQKIIEPVILRPLRNEWSVVRADIEALFSKTKQAPRRTRRPGKMKPLEAAEERRAQFLKRLAEIKILDPACGSGNFLYLALQGVKDIEHQVNIESEKLGLKPELPFIGPEILKGIEINPVAAELARTTIWIGDIQWRIRNGIYSYKPPVLKKLDAIVCQDALITKRADGTYVEAEWPRAEFIVGNPPFLGGKLMRGAMGQDYVSAMRAPFDGRLSEFVDLVCYWFQKANSQLESGLSRRVGLVATNSISGGANRRVLDGIAQRRQFIEAWSDEAWVLDGAAVRVAIICFGHRNSGDNLQLNGSPVTEIFSDLTSGASNLTAAQRLDTNSCSSFVGLQKSGPFDVAGDLARAWLTAPVNPNGRPNCDVLHPYRNGLDITRVSRGKWIVDFEQRTANDAAFYKEPFEYAQDVIKPFRSKSAIARSQAGWWILWRQRPEMRRALTGLRKYIATPEVSKHRIFVWLDARVWPDKNLTVIARDDDTTFGVLHSRFHESWSLRMGTWLGVGNDPRYTPTTTFETFPFPEGLTPDFHAKHYANDPRAVAIATAAKRLDDLRNAWLNPPDLVRIEPEVVPGYPDRILPKDAQAAVTLKKRTLTNLYNQRPQWLDDAHRDLDAAVAAAYGWPADISEEDALAKLLELNLARDAAGKEAALDAGD